MKRFVKIFAENGAAVRLTRQAPFKYVLEQAGVPARDASGAFGARAARKMLMLKLERSRLVVHRGGASRGAGAAAANAPAADLVEEIAGFAAPAPRRRVGVAPLSSTTSSSVSTSPGAAAAPAPGLGKDKAWLASARRSGAASAPKAARVSHGAYNVASDMTFMPAPDAPTPTPPRTKQTLDETGGVPGAGESFESSAERRKLERAFESEKSGSSGGAGAPSRTIPTGPRPFLRDDAPGASPVRAGAPAPTRAEEQKAKPKPALPPPPEEQKAKPKPVAPKPAPAAPKPAAPAPAKKTPAVSAAAPAYVPRPKVTAPAADDDWDLP